MEKIQDCFLIIKPDQTTARQIGKVIDYIECGLPDLSIIFLKMIEPTIEQVYEHYDKDEIWKGEKGLKILRLRQEEGAATKTALEYGQEIVDRVAKYMMSGPLVLIVLRGPNAVSCAREFTGSTEPISAKRGTIRNVFSEDSYEEADKENRALYNTIHCSESESESSREMRIWLTPEEMRRLQDTCMNQIQEV